MCYKNSFGTINYQKKKINFCKIHSIIVRQKSSHIKFCIFFKMFRMNRRHLCAEETVERPRAEKKPKEKEEAGRDTAVAISIKANHYLCGLQPRRKSTL